MAVRATIDGAEKERLRQVVAAQGFARVGFASAAPLEDRITPWIAAGRHAGMEWLAREPQRRTRPDHLLPGAASVICVAASYPASDGRAAVAAYACGDDYHHTLRAALERVVADLDALYPGQRARLCVDTSPLLERALAARAGLGWIGRNTMLLDETHGPWLLLGELLTDLPIAPDAPAVDRCGSCTACVEACPTGALDGQHGLDARACLSYWTIEHRGPLPPEIAAALGSRAFGCDDCLAACPFPRQAPAPPPAPPGGAPFRPRADLARIDHAELEARARSSFRHHFGSTPIERARRGGLLRNLASCRPPDGAGPPRPARHEPDPAEPG